MNLQSGGINIIAHIVFILLVVWISVIFGIENAYKIGKEDQYGVKIARNRSGRAIIRIEWAFVLVMTFLWVFTIYVLGGIALVIEDTFYELVNWAFRVKIESKLGYHEENYVALFYGLLMACGYYSGKAWASYFIAHQILSCVNRRDPLQHPKLDISVLNVLEENMQWTESRSKR